MNESPLCINSPSLSVRVIGGQKEYLSLRPHTVMLQSTVTQSPSTETKSAVFKIVYNPYISQLYHLTTVI